MRPYRVRKEVPTGTREPRRQSTQQSHDFQVAMASHTKDAMILP
jgi:hypothetical protein